MKIMSSVFMNTVSNRTKEVFGQTKSCPFWRIIYYDVKDRVPLSSDNRIYWDLKDVVWDE